MPRGNIRDRAENLPTLSLLPPFSSVPRIGRNFFIITREFGKVIRARRFPRRSRARWFQNWRTTQFLAIGAPGDARFVLGPLKSAAKPADFLRR